MIAAAAPTGRAFRGVSGSGGCAVITAIIHHSQIARNSSIYYFAQGPEPRHDTPGNPQIKPQNYRPDTDSMSGVLYPGDDQRQDNVAFPACRTQQRGQPQLARHRRDRGHVPVRQRSHDAELDCRPPPASGPSASPRSRRPPPVAASTGSPPSRCAPRARRGRCAAGRPTRTRGAGPACPRASSEL